MEESNCLQQQLMKFCEERSDFPFARFNRQKFKWRCYENLDEDSEHFKECIDEWGSREHCHRHEEGGE
jgi:hypothetical protein